MALGRFFAIVFSLLILIGCQSQPHRSGTRVGDRAGATPGGTEPLPDWTQTPFETTPETILFDARSSFEYATFHVPGSIPLRCDEVIPKNLRAGKQVEQHYQQLADRVRRYGVEPGRPIIVLGQGAQGESGEYCVALHLYLLGLHRVQVATIDRYRKIWSNQVESHIDRNIRFWEPEMNLSLVISGRDMLSEVFNGGTYRSTSGPPSEKMKRTFVIDVRPSRDYLKGAPYEEIENLQVLNMPWQEFLNVRGQPRAEMKRQLRSVGIQPTSEVYVYGEDPDSSAAVVLALIAFGYPHVHQVLPPMR